jgi:hypothetical protein
MTDENKNLEQDEQDVERREDQEPEVEGHLFTSADPERRYGAERKINRKIN